jgi:hypothetical protein
MQIRLNLTVCKKKSLQENTRACMSKHLWKIDDKCAYLKAQTDIVYKPILTMTQLVAEWFTRVWRVQVTGL